MVNAKAQLSILVFSAALAASGESAVSITKVAGLPKGLAYKSGKVSGAPAKAGSFTATVTVTLVSNKKKTWIYKVTLNSCISIDRKKKSHKTQPLMEGIDLFDKNDADNRQTDMLHERIQRLQPFDRAIVLLWLENMSYDEIAQIVGINVKNVSVRLYRIKEQLKQMN